MFSHDTATPLSVLQIDLVKPTVVEGVRIFNVKTRENLEDSIGYSKFISGEQNFIIEYRNVTTGIYVEKVSCNLLIHIGRMDSSILAHLTRS